jgi:hypothetical protein
MARPIDLANDAVDVLVLAGDIHNQTGAVELYADYFV